MRLNILHIAALLLSVSWPFNSALAQQPDAELFWGADMSYVNFEQAANITSPRYVLGFKTTESSRFELSYQESIIDINYKKSFSDYKIERFVPFISIGIGGGSESDVNNNDINRYKAQTFIGADYRLNSILELTSGVGLGMSRTEYNGTESDMLAMAQAYIGFRVYPF